MEGPTWSNLSFPCPKICYFFLLCMRLSEYWLKKNVIQILGAYGNNRNMQHFIHRSRIQYRTMLLLCIDYCLASFYAWFTFDQHKMMQSSTVIIHSSSSIGSLTHTAPSLVPQQVIGDQTAPWILPDSKTQYWNSADPKGRNACPLHPCLS